MAHAVAGVDLREPRERDWPAILALANQSVRDVAGAGSQEEWLHNRRGPSPLRRHFVAVEGDAIVGYAAIESRFDQVEQGFRLFVVTSPERRARIAPLLYGRIESLLAELGAAEAWFIEYAADRALLAFLAGWGFEAVRCFALRSGLECVVVSKRLHSGEGPR